MELELFYVKIAEELQKRKMDLEHIRFLPIKYDFQDDEKHFFFSHGIPAIYSIWEGYTRKVLETVLKG
jgi:hypothetical protein